MTAEQISNELLGFISEEIDIDEIENIEYQCGGCWIDLKNGQTFSLTIMQTDTNE